METSQSSSIRQPLFKWLKNSVAIGSSGLRHLPYCLHYPSRLLSHVQKKANLNAMLRRVLVNPVVAFLALIQAVVKSAILNNRIYLAFVLFCLSPFAFTLHVPFDRDIKYGWMGFIENWFHLFNLIGPYLFCLVVLLGVCLLIHPKQKTFKVFKWSLQVQMIRMLFIPIGITIAKIIWLCSVSSNDDFWSIPNWAFFLVGLFIGYIFYRVVEYFTWRKYHAFDALVASIEGLYKIDLDEKDRHERVKPLIQELKYFHSKY